MEISVSSFSDLNFEVNLLIWQTVMVECYMTSAFLLVRSTRWKALGVQISSPLEMAEELREVSIHFL